MKLVGEKLKSFWIHEVSNATASRQPDAFSATLSWSKPIQIYSRSLGSWLSRHTNARERARMALSDILFYLFAALTLLCGFLVVANPFSRNPVTSAMFLALTIVSMAGLFVLLHAFFLAAVQILVYAGAVMVLFLFVIMLLDLKEEQRRTANKFGIVTGIISVGAMTVIFIKSIFENHAAATATTPVLKAAREPLGRILSMNYLWPLQILSLLRLVPLVG